MTDSYLLAQISRLTRLKPRTLQFWTSSGVLEPEVGTLHGGPGKHRRYSQQELEIAALLAPLNAYNFQIGTLRSISAYFRHIFAAGAEFGFADADEAEAMLMLEIEKRPLEFRNPGPERLRLLNWIAVERCRAREAETAFLLHVDGDGNWQIEGFSNDHETKPRQIFEAPMLGSLAVMIIDMDAIFFDLQERLQHEKQAP